MYKCSECGAEYKIKPQYCDCGNDSFEEEIGIISETNILKRYDISIYSVLIFISCIILSILVILFFANPKPQNTEQKIQAPVPMKKQLPNIESFWDNTPVKTVVIEQTAEPAAVIEPKPVVIKKEIKKEAKKEVKQEKPVVSKPVQKVVQTPPQKPKVTTNKEVQNYKLKLRNALFYKLNYSAIQGSGKCGIQFAVNSDGKLINRAFTFQSDNKTLNDEVYKMLMRLPTFDKPPTSYNGEIIKLTIEFDNGAYEVLFAN